MLGELIPILMLDKLRKLMVKLVPEDEQLEAKQQMFQI